MQMVLECPFQDYYDWFTKTLNPCSKKTNCKWLFKAHPAEDKYVSYQYKLKFMNYFEFKNIKMFKPKFSANEILQHCDGIINPRGSSALEFTAQGKLVITSRPWYLNQFNLNYELKILLIIKLIKMLIICIHQMRKKIRLAKILIDCFWKNNLQDLKLFHDNNELTFYTYF